MFYSSVVAAAVVAHRTSAMLVVAAAEAECYSRHSPSREALHTQSQSAQVVQLQPVQETAQAETAATLHLDRLPHLLAAVVVGLHLATGQFAEPTAQAVEDKLQVMEATQQVQGVELTFTQLRFLTSTQFTLLLYKTATQ